MNGILTFTIALRTYLGTCLYLAGEESMNHLKRKMFPINFFNMNFSFLFDFFYFFNDMWCDLGFEIGK